MSTLENIDLEKIPEFRRRFGYLEWHFRPDCPDWPKHRYHTDRPENTYPASLLCRKCVSLHQKTRVETMTKQNE